MVQRYGLDHASHITIAADVSVGNDDPVTLTFGTVIPSAYVSIEQAEAVDATTLGSWNFSCASDCGTDWSHGNARQALTQNVDGSLVMYAAKKDCPRRTERS